MNLPTVLTWIERGLLITMIAAFVGCMSLSILTQPAHAQTYSKCETITGEIIIVEGTVCPPNTIWIGVAG